MQTCEDGKGMGQEDGKKWVYGGGTIGIGDHERQKEGTDGSE